MLRNKLNPVSCLLIALLLTTGRRPEEASSLTWGQYLKVMNQESDCLKQKHQRKIIKKFLNLVMMQ